MTEAEYASTLSGMVWLYHKFKWYTRRYYRERLIKNEFKPPIYNGHDAGYMTFDDNLKY